LSTLVTFFALLVNVLSQLKFSRLMMAPEALCSSLSNGPGYVSCLSGHELNFPFILLPYKLWSKQGFCFAVFNILSRQCRLRQAFHKQAFIEGAYRRSKLATALLVTLRSWL